MRCLDLFSGIGGFSLAASWVWGPDHEIVSFCEIDPFPRKILKKHWPDVPCHDDIKTLRGDSFGTVDLVYGGFPCQPYSCAGKRLGKEDDRALWPEMLRVIEEARPRYVIAENVAGLGSLWEFNSFSDLEGKEYTTEEEAKACFKGISEREGTNSLWLVLEGLERLGYDVQAFTIPACAVGAPHRRDRVWIVAYCTGQGSFSGPLPRICGKEKSSGARHGKSKRQNSHAPNPYQLNRRPGAGGENRQETDDCFGDAADTDTERPQIRKMQSGNLRTECQAIIRNAWNENWPEVAARLCRVDDGLPRGMDRAKRLKALGNSIVPAVVVPIMQAIKKIEECSK